MSKGLSTQWTSHLKTTEDKARFSELVRNSTQVLSRLQTMITEGAAAEDRSLTVDMDCPNWDNKLALVMGKRIGEQRILKLLSFLDH